MDEELQICDIRGAQKLNIDWPDIYFTPEYGRLTEISDNAKWECALRKNG